MPELHDGESVEVWGSGSKPYRLKNVAGVYSCSCPAWRNQSRAIDRRTCKHIRNYRGEEAEAARLETGPTTISHVVAKSTVVAPQLLLAETWREEIDPAGWWLSEKLDGVRAYFDGTNFYSRNGNRFAAPEWFTRGLPNTPLDGELWIGRKQFQRTVSVVRRDNAADLWKEVRFLIFDSPTLAQPFEQRLETITELICRDQPHYAQVLAQAVCHSRKHLDEELVRIEALGGEGLMLRRPGSPYVPRRSDTLFKVKSFRDCEATVVNHEPGKGRHKGRLGALLVELANGNRCHVGTGLSDAERDQPPAIGATITLKYQELTEAGIPRFPVFVRVRTDLVAPSQPLSKGRLPMSMTTTTKRTRRFEFKEGSSYKFWEVDCGENEVLICYGRIGTSGQQLRKPFPDADAVQKHAEQLIRQKTGKGYVEVGV